MEVPRIRADTRRSRGSSPSQRVHAQPLRTVGEIVKERWQARRQVTTSTRPRVHRDWTFALLRAVTNVLLRDLNTALVAEELRRERRASTSTMSTTTRSPTTQACSGPSRSPPWTAWSTVLGSLARLATRPAVTGWWCSRTTASPRAPRSRPVRPRLGDLCRAHAGEC